MNSGTYREDTGLARRVEEASLNAWPALSQLLIDGWVLRFSRGFTKRANSITPLYPETQPLLDKIRSCENLYARENLRTIFRLTNVQSCDALDAALAGRGYTRLDPTLVLIRPSDTVEEPSRREFVELSPGRWLDHYAALSNLPAEARQIHELMLKGIHFECLHNVIVDRDHTLACGLGVLEQDLLGLFDIVTHPEQRRRGVATELIGHMCEWATHRGARYAYLQVEEGNLAGRALYQKLGFQHLYNYWYRISP
jgi:ribosomal protein S18 acetylase RimI-like enzyme